MQVGEKSNFRALFSRICAIFVSFDQISADVAVDPEKNPSYYVTSREGVLFRCIAVYELIVSDYSPSTGQSHIPVK